MSEERCQKKDVRREIPDERDQKIQRYQKKQGHQKKPNIRRNQTSGETTDGTFTHIYITTLKTGTNEMTL
jgi:hypothetical protein